MQRSISVLAFAGLLLASGPLGAAGSPKGLPALTVSDCAAAEGTTAPRECVFVVQLSAAAGQTVLVDAATEDGTATEGSDYAPFSSTLTFAPGNTAEFVTVTLVADGVAEPDESFALRLANPVNASLADAAGTGSIADDDRDGGTLSFNLGFPTTVPETSATGPIAVQRSGGTVGTVSVPYTITPIDATPGVDYAAQDGVLTWGPAESGNRSASYALLDDALIEGPETFTITLGTPTGGAVLGAPSRIIVTIRDDEDHIHEGGFEGGRGRVTRSD